MKWFIPPMPLTRSRTHAATQEPSTVTSEMSRAVAKNSPAWTRTVSRIARRRAWACSQHPPAHLDEPHRVEGLHHPAGRAGIAAALLHLVRRLGREQHDGRALVVAHRPQ